MGVGVVAAADVADLERLEDVGVHVDDLALGGLLALAVARALVGPPLARRLGVGLCSRRLRSGLGRWCDCDCDCAASRGLFDGGDSSSGVRLRLRARSGGS